MNTQKLISINVLLLCLLLIFQNSIAQSYDFRVMVTKGDNKVKFQGAKWAPLKTGVKLTNDAKLKMGKNSYVGLVHISGKTLELSEAGTYEIPVLIKQIGGGSKSIVSKYADFVISKMTPEVIEENRRKYASVTGSGERGVFNSDIIVYLPKTTFLFNNEAILRWKYADNNATYIITFKDIGGKEIFSDESVESFYKVKFNDSQFEHEMQSNLFIVHIAIKGNEAVESNKILIKILDENENLQITEEVNFLQSNLGNESALNYLIMADYFEKEDLPLDVITQYEKAIALSPSVDYFQQVYDEYLIRNVVKYVGSQKPKEK